MEKIKIGFIDYYLDEWHANNYPEFIKQAGGDEFCVHRAYARIDSPSGGLTTEEWIKKYNIPRAESIEEVVEECDCIAVLSPDNPEMHEELAELPLASGKRVYIDKTFAPDIAAAKRLFARAEKYATPLYSCSSLNFADELDDLRKKAINTVYASWGGGFTHQFIHITEPLTSLMGGADRIMCTDGKAFPGFVLDFGDERRAHIGLCGERLSFAVGYGDGTQCRATVTSPYFRNFIKAMLGFFKTGEIPVPHEQTLAVIGTVSAGRNALDNPYEWIDIEI